jgi:hypothetical protein
MAPTRVEILSTDDFSAGTLTVTVLKNGVVVATVVLNDTTQRAAVQLAGVGWAPGDRMTCGWTSVSLAPTTADLIVVVS